MRIGYDAKRLFHNDTGLGHYSRTLIQSLQKEDTHFKACLFDSSPVDNMLTAPFFNPQKFQIVRTGKPSWYYRSINLNKYIIRHDIQLFHGLSNELPVNSLPSGIPRIVTVHDVLFKSFEEDFPWHDRWIYELKTRLALQRSDLVITISEASKRDILKHYDVKEEKIRVIYQSYDPIFDTVVIAHQLIETRNLLKVPSTYLLYVGSITHRKNLMVIVRALQKMSVSERIPLLVLGEGGRYQKQIKEYIHAHRLENWVYFLPDLPRTQIRILYAGAEMLIYPSLGEGFGLPVLEGIAANIPVITSDRYSLPEAGGEVAYYVDPLNAEALKDMILQVDRNPHRANYEQRRKEHLSKFSRSAIARIYLDQVYGPLLG